MTHIKFFHFFSLAFVLATVASVDAQRAFIAYPTDGTTVTAGSQLSIEIDRPNSLSASTEVAIVIGIQSCATGADLDATHRCSSPSDKMGIILYNGMFNPEYTVPSKPPHQNFTVTIPATIPNGPGLLGITHVALIGAGQMPFLETLSVFLNICKKS